MRLGSQAFWAWVGRVAAVLAILWTLIQLGSWLLSPRASAAHLRATVRASRFALPPIAEVRFGNLMRALSSDSLESRATRILTRVAANLGERPSQRDSAVSEGMGRELFATLRYQGGALYSMDSLLYDLHSWNTLAEITVENAGDIEAEDAVLICEHSKLAVVSRAGAPLVTVEGPGRILLGDIKPRETLMILLWAWRLTGQIRKNEIFLGQKRGPVDVVVVGELTEPVSGLGRYSRLFENPFLLLIMLILLALVYEFCRAGVIDAYSNLFRGKGEPQEPNQVAKTDHDHADT
jgi:hypothetical protein